MYRFCPVTGEPLRTVGDFRRYWCEVYESTAGGYLRVGSQYSDLLIPLEVGVLDKITKASPELLDDAFNRIRRIDYKTVSIVAFEQTLLGCYRQKDDYVVLYPDGSRS
jgi:hypothetical protein